MKKKSYLKDKIITRHNFCSWLLSFCFLFSVTNLLAQDQKIPVSGVISDAGTGELLIGVSVVEKGTKGGTITDVDGRYSLKVQPNSTLVVTYIGYSSQEVKVNNQSVVNIAMKDNTIDLLDGEELVVVGFATQKKVNLTGSVGVTTAKELADRPVVSATQALQGLITGLEITQKSGSLEKTPSMNIRGTGTIGQGSSGSPLILIDGMEGDINTINPQDIENVSVLKDASASSIYGSRAPFGVVLITTKKGKAGKTSVTYNNNFRWGAPTVKMQMVDSYTFMQYYNEANRNSRSGGQNFFSEQTLQNVLDYKAGLINGPLPMPANGDTWQELYTSAYADIDWYDIFYKDYNFSQEHNLSTSGGNEKMTYYFSLNYMGQEGLLKLGKENLDRYNVAGKIDVNLTDWAKINYSTRFTRTDYTKPSAMNDGLYENLARQNWPNTPLYDNNGYLLGGRPGRDFLMGGVYDKVKDILYQQLTVEIEPIKRWKLIGDVNYRINSEDVEAYYLRTYDHDINGEPSRPEQAGSSVTRDRYKLNYYNANIRTSYTKTLAEAHNFSGILGAQIEGTSDSKNGLRRYGLIYEGLPVPDLTNDTGGYDPTTGEYPTKYPTAYGSGGSWATAGFFGRINYDYKGRYLFEANLRYDGSSRFRRYQRWDWFPSFSVGWNLAQESFWEPMKEAVGVLKLRASYGELGNANTDGWYPTYLQLDIKPNSGAWLQNGMKPLTVNTPKPISSTLAWETIQSSNIGLDWGALNSRLTGSVDYFVRKTLGMLGDAIELPSVFGIDPPRTNDTSLKTYGWELEIAWRDRLKNGLSYGAKFMVSDAQTKVTEFPNNPTNSIWKYIVGEKTNNIFGYTTVGIAKSEEEMQAHLAQLDANYEKHNGVAPSVANSGQNGLGTNWGAGDIMYADLNGDGIVNSGDGTLGNSGDLKKIGNSTPRFQFGLDLNAAWKGFDFRAFFQGVMKRDYWQGSSYFWGANTDAYWSTALVQHMDFYRDENSLLVQDGVMGVNKDAYYPRPSFDAGSKYGRNHHTQTRYLQNAAYIRLKNVQIGYTLPQKITRKASIDKLRIYFSGENLWTGTNLSKIFDPETVSGGNYNTSADWRTHNNGNAYPLSKSFSCGLSATF